MNDSRRDFVRLTIWFVGAGALASSLEGCGSTGKTDGGPDCSINGAHDSDITENHGHTLLVPAADFSAAGDKTYDIRGTATHTHTITLTQAQRASILGATMVTVTSTVDEAHSHDVTVACL